MGNPPKSAKAAAKSNGSTPSPPVKSTASASPARSTDSTIGSNARRAVRPARIRNPLSFAPPPSDSTDRPVPAVSSLPSRRAVGRKKIRIERIADERNRQVTFTKRVGLMKKAMELSVLCDCQMRSSSSTPTTSSSSTSGDINQVLTRFKNDTVGPHEKRTNKDLFAQHFKNQARNPDVKNPPTTTTTTDSTKTAKRARAPTRALARVAPPRAAVNPPRRLPRLPRLSHSPEMEIPNARIRRRRRNLRRDGTRARIPWTRTSSTRRRAWRRSRPRPRVHLRSIPWAETLGGFWNTFQTASATRWARPGLRRERRRGARRVPYPRRARPRRGRGRG